MTDGGRFVCRAALLATGLVLAAWVAIVVEHRVRRGPLREAWAHTIADMRAAGEPVELADLRSASPVVGLEYRAWLEGFQKLAGERPLSSRFAETTMSYENFQGTVALRRILVARTIGKVDPWGALHAVFERERSWDEVVTGEAEALASLRTSESALFVELESLDAIGGVDAEGWMSCVLDSAPRPDTFCARTAADLLGLEAVLATVDEDPIALEAALRRLLVLFRQNAAIPTLVQNRLAESILGTALLVIENSADLRASRFVVDELEPALAAIDLRGGLVRAFRGETFVMLASRDLRTSLGVPADCAPEDLASELDLTELQFLHDEISRGRAVADALELPFVQGKAAIAAACGGASGSTVRVFRTSFGTVHLGPSVPGVVLSASAYETAFEQTVARELALAFTRLRLRARVSGVAGARELAATLVDPYDGKPLRVHATDEAELVVWSVGPDGVDQSGAAATGVVAGDDVRLELPEE